ncbi:retron Se72 family effector protein [Polaromonas naphthalenivorans]|uniref:Cold-shock DNA-binding protein family n=1 Tax=Polaromonas naphthalenivorans (strain CJ2) TaxID=365044 RepID=A1VLY3_POLNA|nr:retron Se72 family effector protein [Polaromonas naphthalenivorans]ABM36661.1 cold-shock DNA-binding protein family [Polaromonas naphthalenivorans CJ2]
MENSNNYGVVKVYYPLKGFGFISRAKGKDLFFYRDSVKDEAALIEGATVSFQIKTTEKGLRAVNLTREG